MEYKTFSEFYPFYLSQHQNIMCRRLHFFGNLIALFFLIGFIFTFSFKYLILAIILGYGLAWIGHYFFEKNKPTTCKHPLYSLMGDFMMFKDVLQGKIKIF